MKKLISITAISCLLSGCAGFTNLPNSNGNLNTYNQGSHTLNEQDKRDLGIIIGGSIICRDSKSKLASEWHSLSLEGTSLAEKLNPEDKGNVTIFSAAMLYNPYIIKKGMPQTNDSLARLIGEKDPKIKYEIAITAQKQYGVVCSRSGLSEVTNRFKQISANIR